MGLLELGASESYLPTIVLPVARSDAGSVRGQSAAQSVDRDRQIRGRLPSAGKPGPFVFTHQNETSSNLPMIAENIS